MEASSARGGSTVTETATTTRRRLLAVISVQLAAAVTMMSGQPVSATRQSEPTPTDAVRPAAPTREVAIALAFEQQQRAIGWGDQPFGAVIVQLGFVVGEGPSRVILNGDPSAHAEMEAVRDACRQLGTRDLSGCEIYATARPCRMCDAVLGWARVSRVYYGADGLDAGAPGSGRC